jgi:diaminopimelate epimerase
MALSFYKYQGTGNDFIMINNFESLYFSEVGTDPENIALLCNRHLGIGADGLILLNPSTKYDFHMQYFNADGKEGSMCGNGGRCAAAFAKMLGIIGQETTFSAIDGLHKARIIASNNSQTIISLQLNDAPAPDSYGEQLIFNTGSPHLIVFAEEVSQIAVTTEGRKIRYSDDFEAEGINVNFVEVLNNESLFVRTYERGVEDETLSCGTGVTASALAAWSKNIRNLGNMYNIKTLGGSLKVSFSPPGKGNTSFSGIWLTGPTEIVFKGEIQF